MRTLLHHAAGLTTLGLVAAPLAAQIGQNEIQVAGVGAIVDQFDVETQSGNSLMLGVAYVGGSYFVTGGGGAGSNMVFVYDEDGTLTGSFDQISTTAFGYRDGATDGLNVMFGCEDGIYVHDSAGNVLTTIEAANGPQTVASPIAGDGLAALGIYRGVAYNPEGNGGNGSIWTATFGSDLIEITLDGTVLNTLSNNVGWSIYGLAWDPFTETLLCNSIPSSGDIGRLDPATGDLLDTITRTNPGSSQGGLSLVVRSGDLGWQNNGLDIVALDQAGIDSITRYRVHTWTKPLRNGFEEARMTTGVDGGDLDGTAVKVVGAGATLDIQVGVATQGAPLPVFLYVNSGDEATVNGVTERGRSANIQEFVALTRHSTPVGDADRIVTRQGETVSIPLPAGLEDGDYVRVQAVTINPNGQTALTATNQMFFQLDLSRVTVEANGTNSFNSNTSSGFFRVTHRAGASITAVEFDWTTSSNPEQFDMEFDTDQGGMADVFEGGNSLDPDCEGTYRNGCDVDCGLLYDAGNTIPSTPCDPAANTGWIGTNAGGSAGDWQTIQFRFNAGMFAGRTFEFDADTDLGQGTSGGDMEGMVVTITLDNGDVLQGELAADPDDANRSFIRFL